MTSTQDKTNIQQQTGKDISRVDGRLKVTGEACYSAEFPLEGIAHGYLIQSTIAKGRIKAIDTSEAELPGVLAILTHQNAPKINALADGDFGSGYPGDKFLPLQSDRIYFDGQHIGIVIAETLEQARLAASLTKIAYEIEEPVFDLEQALEQSEKYDAGEKLQPSRGDVSGGLKQASVTIEETYTTPLEHHNPMETSATTAEWHDDELTVYDATQWVMGTRGMLAKGLGLPEEKVRVISHFVGGGFGCKGLFWTHPLLAAIAARKVNRPVRLMLTRQQMFSACGHRPRTIQKITLGADDTGKLTAIRHLTDTETSFIGDHAEPCGMTTTLLYACPNLEVKHNIARVNVSTPTPMRGPGETSGTFALESAMDELAYKADIDPVEFRIINHADRHPQSNKPWSSKYLIECYHRAADAFGWQNRDPRPGSMGDGDELIGWGMATATYPGYRFPAAAKAQILANGQVIVGSATHDIGTGTYTIMSQIAADTLGLPIERVKFELGDTKLPKASVSGGSSTAGSVSPAVRSACEAACLKLIEIAIADSESPLHNYTVENITTEQGRIFVAESPNIGETYQEILQRHHLPLVEAEVSPQDRGARYKSIAARTKPGVVEDEGADSEKFAFHSFGAHFAEVRINPRRNQVRVTRMVGAFDIGRVLNQKTARSQIYGGVIFGIGMALMEETLLDPHSGRVIIHNLADYHVPIQADIPQIEAIFVEKPDYHFNPLGARGIGEISTTGVAAAVANAVYHATGKRVRDLPITPDKLL
ncbi:xanthine dehydrogenase family protein molybdopterin-binding subunit [Pleurocapsa sp. PCC 7319]|uniref:xanthine dehydrogenase family protein molybdopterin-binding subunit n=1 Tax=Pleurocapsa sp. PCC 7319 TaxID=118161 RepID=UPI00034C9559|nr:xanthine dehydrogenase family protein molybdopterin-binding subunit [Pleurocapsa sp. PCC 7319]